MLQFGLGISLSEAEHELVQPIGDAATEVLLLANDYFSWERELREVQSGHSKRIVSTVELFARTMGLSVEDAKEAVKSRIIKNDIKILSNGNGGNAILNGKTVVNGNGAKRKLSQYGMASPEHEPFVQQRRSIDTDVLCQKHDIQMVSQYRHYKPSNLALDAPAAYMSGMPSKGVRGTLIDALSTWLHKFNLACPTKAEYINIIDHKTGGIFRILPRVMQAEYTATETPGLNFERLTLLFGRFFQIRDDYMSFGDHAAQKGLCEDLDEGRFSYPIVYCLANHPKYRGHILGVFRQRPTVATITASPLSKESKAHLVSCLRKCGAFKKTLDCLRDVEMSRGFGAQQDRNRSSEPYGTNEIGTFQRHCDWLE
ncbi:geranylgeranyl pyrophosphate synthase [Fusarium denticulatum]|uniref:Geranylgeranyl pyrophosphate synthase n=1 Tax=Fusarium denticulatum TaxID=48507 RepID=A0A8H5U967_9HYPO|nr:geranylgeranyl pyrophosphate synthase [Fusarium denticulatum]